MKTKLSLLILCIAATSTAQINILDTSTWTIGTGSITGFSRNGVDSENVRELGINPHGENTVLWKAVPNAANDADGGWNSSYHNINPTKNYRYSVWIKKRIPIMAKPISVYIP